MERALPGKTHYPVRYLRTVYLLVIKKKIKKFATKQKYNSPKTENSTHSARASILACCDATRLRTHLRDVLAVRLDRTVRVGQRKIESKKDEVVVHCLQHNIKICRIISTTITNVLKVG